MAIIISKHCVTQLNSSNYVRQLPESCPVQLVYGRKIRAHHHPKKTVQFPLYVHYDYSDVHKGKKMVQWAEKNTKHQIFSKITWQ